jgi:hypothetical protein
MDQNQKCICTRDRYRQDCPYTFEQGGSKFHCIGGDLRAVRADDDTESNDSWENDSVTTGVDGLLDALRTRALSTTSANSVNVEGAEGRESVQITDTRNVMDGLRFRQGQHQSINRPPMLDEAAQVFLEQNRINLNRFDALKLNGQSINDYSIGGFKLDIKETAAVVKKLVPLPPSALPKIFINDDLNFYHHFFQGTEALLGNEMFRTIVDSRSHYDTNHGALAEAVTGFIQSGMEKKDNAVTMFVKKVLSSTFERSIIENDRLEIPALRVVANLWGFRYIEPHMILKDVDIKMWLSTCYNHYRTLWFDTFKSSGVPLFATEGVVHNYNAILNTTKVADPVTKGTQRQISEGRVVRADRYSDRYVDDRAVVRSTRRSSSKRSTGWFH